MTFFCAFLLSHSEIVIYLATRSSSYTLLLSRTHCALDQRIVDKHIQNMTIVSRVLVIPIYVTGCCSNLIQSFICMLLVDSFNSQGAVVKTSI